jgi:NAD(P)-dependent dehydrogenase (short-subunit alcohol dehydrogenase family)
VTDTPAIHQVVDEAFADLGKIGVVVNNAGYGLFGAAEELTRELGVHRRLLSEMPPISSRPVARKYGYRPPEEFEEDSRQRNAEASFAASTRTFVRVRQ